METYTDKVGAKLNSLLEKNYDAEKGYRNAAENVKNDELKKFFIKKSTERHDFALDLKTEIASFNQDADKYGSVAGDLHRTWMDLKSILSVNNDEAVLEEAIRGEKASVEEYNEVLSETALPKSTKSVLETQKTKIEADLASVKVLEFLH
ncbi:uncharacterized protein (TIGR02284 family) [Wenyingzhuangia heitensis]|uniref:Uncharacterized protein (TIGR02284 family) n=1 Tax=Wenyingzhuangia heitensis TaxID=1487859 RepID=A0ABX0U8Q6_9FLAO|nr:PA2169 family four-helix-bundle protein [Wenyingzhuangia heitensis]NIJ45232.1 uncharacterized protein (TIGR02284 family) [Wenyingzhuangia heitensis]